MGLRIGMTIRRKWEESFIRRIKCPSTDLPELDGVSWHAVKFTLALIFFRWQTLIGGILLHASWKLGWAEINRSSR